METLSKYALPLQPAVTFSVTETVAAFVGMTRVTPRTSFQSEFSSVTPLTYAPAIHFPAASFQFMQIVAPYFFYLNPSVRASTEYV